MAPPTDEAARVMSARQAATDTSLPEPQPGIAELPFEPERIIVVSDLHLSAGREMSTGRYRPGENFLAGATFRTLLEQFEAKLSAGPVLLVLNGDTFDFVRIDDRPRLHREFVAWHDLLASLGVDKSIDELKQFHRREERYGLRTDDYKSVWKLARIVEGHPEFFEALGWWVESGGRIAIVKGNHDLELYWPLVQRALRRIIASHTTFEAAADRIYFVQAGLRIGNVYLEHGHQFESTTAVKGDPILASDPTQLHLPLGSFVNRYLINPLERLEPFLDNVKPVSRVIGALLRRHPLRIFRILWRAVPFLRRAARPYWLREWLAFALFFGSLLIPFLTLAAIVAAIIWPNVVSGIPGALRPVLSVGGMLAPWLGGVARDALLTHKPNVGEDSYAAGIYERLARVTMEARYTWVYGVLGHTHRPDLQELPPLSGSRVLYVNAGTWVPCWSDDRPDLTGRVVYSVVEFTADGQGRYRHRSLEWRPDAGKVMPAVLLAPRIRLGPGGFLTDRQLKTVRAFAEVFIEGDDKVLDPDEVAANVDAHLARVRTNRKQSLRLVLRLIEYLMPLLDGRWRFSRQSPEVRRSMIERRLANPRAGPLFRNLAKIRTLFAVGYYGSTRVYPSIGFVPVQDRPRNLPPNPPLGPIGVPMLPLRAPAHGETSIEADLCVIGSGAGGAVVAALAAQSGRRVVLLEEGRYFHSSALSHREHVMSASLYKESGLQSTVDLGMTILQGRALGGTTVINNHICFRLNDPLLTPGLPDTLAQWRNELQVEIDRARLDESFDRVVEAIQARPIHDEIIGANGTVLLDGWNRLRGQGGGNPKFASGRFTKNYNQTPGQRCGGCGYCNFGCPYQRKLSMLETYVTAAHEAGARILTECKAERILREGARATGVEGRLGDGRSVRIKADQVVVAAGAIGSTVLLLRSGFRSRPVGRRFSFNAATPLFAHFPEPIDAYDGIQMASYIDAGDALLESAFNPPMTFAVSLPGWFQTHFDRMRAFRHFASAGVVIATSPTGRVKRSNFTRRTFGPVAWRMDGADFDRVRTGLSLLAQVYFAAGADYVLPATLHDCVMKADRFAPGGRVDGPAIERFIRSALTRPAMLTLNSSHPQGGNVMSADPRHGVVDAGCRVHGTENLYVCDASVFPTSVRVNPQLTIMAVADYAWHQAISREPRA